MYKLYKIGVTGKLWSVINDCHIDTMSSVIVNQCQSEFFPVLQGVRQGGLLSGLLYLVFINDMLVDLEKCNKKTGVYHIASCSPALADDISCIGTTPLCLQRMLDICADYAHRWRFCFNANKSCVMQFSLNPREVRVTYDWHIANSVLPVAEEYTHLGIALNSKFRSTERTSNACRKGKNSYFALNGVCDKSTHPCVLLKLFKSIVLPTVLYGCEMWTSLKSNDIAALNRFQHFIVKRILDLKTSTRSDMCQSILGLHTITSSIETKKLYFLQKLCSLDDNFLTKKIFLVRLFTYFIDNERNHHGFIPDIMNILYKYSLNSYMLDFLREVFFSNEAILESYSEKYS